VRARAAGVGEGGVVTAGHPSTTGSSPLGQRRSHAPYKILRSTLDVTERHLVLLLPGDSLLLLALRSSKLLKRPGQGRAGQGRAGQGRAGQGHTKRSGTARDAGEEGAGGMLTRARSPLHASAGRSCGGHGDGDVG
jgi:hypothetical protein